MLVTPQEWLDRRFGDAKQKPHTSSVRRWIEAGELPGKKIGGRYYVELDIEKIETGNPLVDRVLKAS